MGSFHKAVGAFVIVACVYQVGRIVVCRVRHSGGYLHVTAVFRGSDGRALLSCADYIGARSASKQNKGATSASRPRVHPCRGRFGVVNDDNYDDDRNNDDGSVSLIHSARGLNPFSALMQRVTKRNVMESTVVSCGVPTYNVLQQQKQIMGKIAMRHAG